MLSGMARIAIIGGGSIGEALLSGLLRAGRQVKDLVVVERVPERAKYLADTYSVLITSVAEAVENASFVVVAVKPADVESVMSEVARAAAAAESDTAEQVFVTVAAGVTIAYFEAKLPAGTPVVRAMPNTAALVGAGVTALAKGRFVTPPQLEERLGPVRLRRRGAERPRGPNGRRHRVVGLGSRVFLPDGRGAHRRRRCGGAEPRGGGRSDRADHGRRGGDAAGTDGRRSPAFRGRGARDAGGRHRDAAAGDRDVPGGTTAAALRELERGGLRAAVDAAVQAAKMRSEQLRITSE